MHQIFIPNKNFKNNYVIIDGDDFHHLVNVLRIKINEKLFIVVDKGDRFIGRVNLIEKNRLIVELIEKIKNNFEPNFNLYIAQSIPKGKKIESIIKYGTELGIKGFFPLITERTVVKLNPEKIERLKKIAKEEAQVSKRDILPEIFNPISFNDLIKNSNKYEKKYIFWELEKENFIDVVEINKGENIIVVIGNEGGFSLDEVYKAKKYGFISISLGNRILRSELAPLVIISLIIYKGGGFNL
ncbi:MAG: RsmE family RNA methyltransferase [Caldisericia bacterium]